MTTLYLDPVQNSSSNQYSSIWSSFCGFVKTKNPGKIDDTFIMSYLRFLFFDKKLAPTTIASYKSALSRPLRYAFKVDLSTNLYIDFIKALGNIRPNKPQQPIRWSLDKALSLALSPRFQENPSIYEKTLVTIFLVALATGARVSELSTLLRLDDNLLFSGEGVTIFPNPNFLAEKESDLYNKIKE